jgi:hypothetical protein
MEIISLRQFKNELFHHDELYVLSGKTKLIQSAKFICHTDDLGVKSNI